MSPALRAPLRLAPFRETVTDAPVSYSVYSAFSFYGARRGGELPGTWLVAALSALGHEVAAIRQTLYRMEGSRELVSRSSGRRKQYRLSPYARAEAEAGLAKIMERAPLAWDGRWTLVQFQTGTEDRIERERLRELLRVEGFAVTGIGLFIHPRDRSARLLRAAAEHRVSDLVEVFRALRLGGRDEKGFVARHWDLATLAGRYRGFLNRFRPLERESRRIPLEAAFLLRFAVVFDYLETAWDDPDLPAALLPARWPGVAARNLARRLYRSLLPRALAFGDGLSGPAGLPTAATAHRLSRTIDPRQTRPPGSPV